MTELLLRAQFLPVLGLMVVLAPGALLAQAPDAARLMQHLSVLAADSMEGRAPGTRGHSAAATYIERELRALGVDGGAADGTYRLRLPTHRVNVDFGATVLRFSGGSVSAADSLDARSFHLSGRSVAAYRSFAGPARWLGNAAEAGAALDRGKTMSTAVAVLVAGGAPLEPVLARLHNAGAVGAVVLVRDSARYAALREGRGLARHFLEPTSTADPAGSIPLVIVGPAGSDRIRLGIGSAGVQMELRLVASTTPIEAWNVVGRVRGTDARRRDSTVVFMAHYDHIGLAELRTRDRVYNGLVDNATGVAALLEIARLVKARPLPWSAVFLFLTLEEEGSLGSQHHLVADNALATRTVAAINLDHPPALAPPVHWYLETNDSSVARAGRAAASALGSEAESLPPQPTSDHWRFMQRGVPTAFIVPGDRWRGMSSAEIESATARWWRPHQLDDEWSPDFPVSGLAATVEFALRLAREMSR